MGEFIMSTAAPQKKLVPPDEKFWRRYSGHHEMPLAGMTSLLVHAAIFGLLFVVGMLALMSWHDESNKPAQFDVVQLGPGDGTGPGDNGGGSPAAGLPQENVPVNSDPLPDVPIDPKTEMPKVTPSELKLSPVDIDPVQSPADDTLLKLKELQDDAKKSATPPPAKSAAPIAPRVAVNPNGKGGTGQGGSGGGTGKGIGKGTGNGLPGNGRPGGGDKTQQQIYADRWHFDIEGDPKEHARKLLAVGAILGFYDAAGRFYTVSDLSRRPVQKNNDRAEKYANSVQWFNQSQQSIIGLAKELKLDFVPSRLLILLPKEREEIIAEKEMQYAREHGRGADNIHATYFDFRRNAKSTSEPIVLKQE